MKLPNVTRCAFCGRPVAQLFRRGPREVDDLDRPHVCPVRPIPPVQSAALVTLNHLVEEARDANDPRNGR